MKYKKYCISATLLFLLVFQSCNDKAPISQQSLIIGTWKIESIFLGNTPDSVKMDYVALLSQNFPCIKNYSVTFQKDSTFLINSPNNCLDMANSTALFLLPEKGKYTWNNTDFVLKMLDNDNTKIGVTIFKNNKLNWQIMSSDNSQLNYEYVFSK